MANLRDLIPTINPLKVKPDAQWPVITPYTGSGPYWRACFVHHLTGAENVGKRNVYVDLVDKRYNLLNPAAYGAKIGYTWEGQRPEERTPPAPMDKQPPEPAGNVVLFAGQVTTVYISSGYPSDWVGNLRTSGLPELDTDGESGNYQGHNSYYTVYMLDRLESESPPVVGTIDFQPLLERMFVAAHVVSQLAQDFQDAIGKLNQKG